MPRVHFVKKARRPIGDIKAGEPYYWWQFRKCPKSVSRTPPKPSQLTRSEFWGAIYGLQEEFETVPGFDDLDSQLEDLKGRLEEIRDELADKQSNLEAAFPNGCPSLETITNRHDSVESAIGDLDSVDTSGDFEEIEEDDMDQAKADRAEEIWQDVTSALDNISD